MTPRQEQLLNSLSSLIKEMKKSKMELVDYHGEIKVRFAINRTSGYYEDIPGIKYFKKLD